MPRSPLGAGTGTEILDWVHAPGRLSNHRLVKLRDDRVTFTWKDYADSCRQKEMTLEAVEFMRRFSSHHTQRVSTGSAVSTLAHRDRGERLALCRSLLAAGTGPAPAPRPTRRRRVPVPDRRTATRHRVGRDQRRLRSSPSRQRHLGWVSPSWWSWSLLVASGDTTSFASSPAVPPAAGLVDDRCPGCGVGHLQTIWQAGRPGRIKRQRIAILDSS